MSPIYLQVGFLPWLQAKPLKLPPHEPTVLHLVWLWFSFKISR